MIKTLKLKHGVEAVYIENMDGKTFYVPYDATHPMGREMAIKKLAQSIEITIPPVALALTKMAQGETDHE